MNNHIGSGIVLFYFVVALIVGAILLGVYLGKQRYLDKSKVGARMIIVGDKVVLCDDATLPRPKVFECTCKSARSKRK